MKHYQIADLEQLSGIKAHTIRIWEKRYNLIEPERTDTNIRLYNDEQVRKLLNVSTLLSNGLKISKIAALSEKEMHLQVKQLQQESGGHSITHSFINDLIASMLNFDEAAFEKTYSAAVTRLGMFESMLQVFYPFLHKTGMMWATGNAMPVQEHFASGIIRRKLQAATDGLLPPSRRNPSFLLLLPPDEWHEIGLMFSNYIIRAQGYPSIYLGQNVPFENVKQLYNYNKPTHVLLFLITRRPDQEVKQLRQLMGLPPQTNLLLAGNPFLTGLCSKSKYTHVLNSPPELLNFL